MTADLNSNMTIKVYLLNKDAASPEDGTLLDVINKNELFCGCHRIALNYNFLIPVDSKISVVQEQQTKTKDGTVYSVPFTVGLNQRYMEAQNVFELANDYQLTSWAEGVVNRGESWICTNGVWTDWLDVIEQLKAQNEVAAYISFDNLNMKLYLDSIGEIERVHKLGDKTEFRDFDIRICDECGYSIIEK